jgi:hypothetical protein
VKVVKFYEKVIVELEYNGPYWGFVGLSKETVERVCEKFSPQC